MKNMNSNLDNTSTLYARRIIKISIKILKDHLPQRMVKVLIIFSNLSIGSFKYVCTIRN